MNHVNQAIHDMANKMSNEQILNCVAELNPSEDAGTMKALLGVYVNRRLGVEEPIKVSDHNLNLNAMLEGKTDSKETTNTPATGDHNLDLNNLLEGGKL